LNTQRSEIVADVKWILHRWSRLIEKPNGILKNQTVITPKHQGDLDFLWKQRDAGSGPAWHCYHLWLL